MATFLVDSNMPSPLDKHSTLDKPPKLDESLTKTLATKAAPAPTSAAILQAPPKSVDGADTRAVICDLDGTLLRNNHTIGQKTLDALQAVHDSGTHVVIATGRHYADASELVKDVPAKYLITCNGSRTHAGEQLLRSHNLDVGLVRKLVLAFQDLPGMTVNVYTSHSWLRNRAKDPECPDNMFKSGFRARVEPDLLAGMEASGELEEVAKVFLTCGDHERLVRIEQQLVLEYGDSVHVVFSYTNCLEVSCAEASKGAALGEALGEHGIELDKHCIAFGDSMNDYSMLSVVREGLIMDNAHSRLKTSLPHCRVIGSNDDEAVAHFIARNLLDRAAEHPQEETKL